MAADPNQLKQDKSLNRSDILFCLARVPESSRLFVGSSDFNVYDIDLAAEKPEAVPMAGHESYVTGMALAGEHVVSGSYDGRLIWWHRETREQVRAVDAHAKWVRGVAATPAGDRVVSVADDMVCRVWDAASGSKLHELRGHEEQTPNHYPSMLYACAISADGRLLATADRVGHVVVWDLESGEQLAKVEAPVMYTWDPTARRHSIGGIRSVAFSPDAKLLAIGGMGQVGNIDHLGGLARLEVFDWQAGERTHEFPGDDYKGLIEHLAFHPEGDWLMAAGGDHNGFVKFFDLKAGKLIKQDKAPMHVHDFALDETCETAYAVGHGRILTWTLKA